MENMQDVTGETSEPPKVRVYGFVDGFNLYHALEKFEPAQPVSDPNRYQKYKWLCLKSLLNRFVLSKSEMLIDVEYFTAYPNWHNSEQKRRRHETYVSALKTTGVQVTFGEFKPKKIDCQARCRFQFETYVEKQTDINIAMRMIQLAGEYDKAILLTADSDQVPTIRLLKHLYPQKSFAILPPVGRGAKELQAACDVTHKMTEAHLAACQLPNPIQVPNTKAAVHIAKPTTWP